MVLYSLSPLIPKDITLKMENSHLTGMRAASSTEFRASLQSLETQTCFVLRLTGTQNIFSPIIGINNSLDHCLTYVYFLGLHGESVVPEVSLGLQLDGLDVRDEREKVFLLQKLTLRAGVSISIIHHA